MNTESIQLIRTTNNEMVVAQVTEETDDYIYVTDPVVLVPSNDGNVTLMPWSPLGVEGSTLKVDRRGITYYATPNEQVIQNYTEVFSKIITPQQAGKIIT